MTTLTKISPFNSKTSMKMVIFNASPKSVDRNQNN